MVDSVLLELMRAERDFDFIEPLFFSTTQAGTLGPDIGRPVSAVRYASDPDALIAADVLISCQGGEYIPESTVPS